MQQPHEIAGDINQAGGPSWRREREMAMDHSIRMVIIAGLLMLALLIAIVGSVSADAPIWASAATALSPMSQPL
jgi:hypothetical protein